jgi:hypothetical protein
MNLVELHILINAVDCSALWHPATVRAAARVVALTASNDVFLDLCGADRYVERGVKTTPLSVGARFLLHITFRVIGALAR